ncbi:MAG TPA: DUF3667 domain-containing protein [Salinimicrobium sp.]|nr:DUF3667 domain-containing protein [Salinimicrobium sp.]
MENPNNITAYRGLKCLNCLTPLDISDRFCSYCGQKNSAKKLNFNDFFNEFFAGIFAYDSKIYRSISALLFHPGKISVDYVNGKRNSYVNPFKFYLSVSILFFILYGSLNTTEGFIYAEKTPEGTEKPIIQETALGIKSNKNYASEKELNALSAVESYTKRFLTYYFFYQNNSITDPHISLEKLAHPVNDLNIWMYKKATTARKILEDPSIFTEFLLAKLPYFIFFFLPFFTLFIWLVYVRSPFTYMEHLVFTFHNQTMALLVFIFALAIDFFTETSVATTIAQFLLLFYLYKSMRRFYKQGRFKTISKFVLLNGLFFILAIFAGVFAILTSLAVF